MKLQELFRDPGSAYRSLPFWGWNDRMKKDEIIRQIHSMHKAGIGGFFLHSRDGLETPYMGDEWKSLIRVAAEEAEALGMEAWLYDEDRWPSGTAGGTLARKWGDDSRCKGLTLEVCDPADSAWQQDNSQILARYAAVVQGMELSTLRRLADTDAPTAGEVLLLARLEVSGKSEWFNNEAPPDNLNPESVAHFLELTHEEYKQTVGHLFGKSVKGIFTDEPSLHDRHAAFPRNRGWIPWTVDFDEYFQERRGYDSLDWIPHLYFNSPHSRKIRHDYWRTVAERYAVSYSGVIGDWCRKNGIAYTGHFLQEDKLGLSTRVNGSIMPHYKEQDVPGIDMLEEYCEQYLTVKQCSSVAHQYGKPMVLSEAFGCTGWEFSFEGQKWIGDWQFALGVNRLAKHMALYSLRGCRKRDYPPSFNDNTSWWPHARIMEDYFTRISALLIHSTPVRDLLVLHPQSTAWSMLGCNPYGNPVRREERDVPAVDEYGYRFNALLRRLSGLHYDYDLGDEQLMAADAFVESGKLHIAKAAYGAVLLPQVDTLLASTVKLLSAYLDAGGHLIAMAPLPTLIEGAEDTSIAALFVHPNCKVVEGFEAVASALPAILPRRLRITNPLGEEDRSVLAHLSDTGEDWVLFLANNDRHNAHEITLDLSLGEAGTIRLLDPLTGESTELAHTSGPIPLWMEGADSKLLLISKTPAKAISQPVEEKPRRFYVSFPPECTVTRDQPNGLTLDICQYRLGDEDFSAPMEVWAAQKELRERLAMRPVYYNGIEQRYQWIGKAHPADGTSVSLRFLFEADYPASGVQLAVERIKDFAITLNGTAVTGDTGWFLDPCFQTVALPDLAVGANVLEFSCAYTHDMELEMIYLLGDFGVDSRRRIIPENPDIRTGDWTLQGYPYYAGSMRYSFPLPATPPDTRVFVKLADFAATTAIIHVNGHSYPIPWKAASLVDITDALPSDGDTTIEVEIVGSPRNLLGPFHCAEGKPDNTNDASFTRTGPKSVAGYQLHPYGLYRPPVIEIQER